MSGETIKIQHATNTQDIQVATCGEPLPADPRTVELTELARGVYESEEAIVFLFTERAVVYLAVPNQEHRDHMLVQPVLTIAHKEHSAVMLEAALHAALVLMP